MKDMIERFMQWLDGLSGAIVGFWLTLVADDLDMRATRWPVPSR